MKEAKQYRKDKKTIAEPGFYRLKDKLSFGGSVGTEAMNKINQRDMEMNGGLYKEAAEERKRIRINRLFKCSECGGRKNPKFRICYECNQKRLKNETP